MGYKDKLIVILGPTAVGKTDLSIELAKKLDTEIISGDSMLIYKGLDIGTAKPSSHELSTVKHHMIDILEPDMSYNVTDFLDGVKPIISEINQRHKIPILAGGTGLYIKALLEGYEFNKQGEDRDYRLYLEGLANEKGNVYVYEMLREIDPIAAARLHPNNLRRVIRALETIHLGNESISQDNKFKLQQELAYNVKVIGLNRHRSELYERINQRVDIMINSGLVDEVKNLLSRGAMPQWQSMRGIGYKEIIQFLNDYCTREDAIIELKKNTRHFAKRQITWFKKMPYIKWFDLTDYEEKGIADRLINDVLDYIGEENFNDEQ